MVYDDINNYSKDDTIVILEERMMGWLCYNNFHKLNEKKDLKDTNRRIYIFKDSPELRKCMSKYERINNNKINN